MQIRTRPEPSPLYQGRGQGDGTAIREIAPFADPRFVPSPQPSPLSTGERETCAVRYIGQVGISPDLSPLPRCLPIHTIMLEDFHFAISFFHCRRRIDR